MRYLVLLAVLFSLVGPPASVASAAVIPLYTDALAANWGDWSWGAQTHSFANLTPVHLGSKSIQITFTGGYSGVQIGANSAVPSTAAVNTVEFWIHGGSSGGQSVRVSAGNDCSSVSQELTLAANTWTQVSLSLAGLGTPADVQTVSWANPKNSAQPVFYVDDVALISASLPAAPVASGPALAVDAAAGRHAISPLIYGMNFPDEALAAELHLPLQRWGGNSTTRYNYLEDSSNRASDWYFENIPNQTANPALLPEGSASNLFIEQGRRTGSQILLTVPLIGWTPKDRTQTCGFSIAKYGPQQDRDPWATDCGNGFKTDGTPLVNNDPLDTSLAISPAFVQNWIQYLSGKFGGANAGGVRFYNLDNEPMLWNSTHRDVHPDPVSYDELLSRTLAYAPAIKATDPGAQTLGPVLWGWTAYFYSALDAAPGGAWWNDPQDYKAHDSIPLVAWYLQQMKLYEQQHGLRILDYLDLHYYPQSGIFSPQAGDQATQQLRLRSTRSLWDPTYTDESWINDQVQLIPRMKAWNASNYPGTKTAISEYSWGAMCHISGALAQADVLGIFGREGLDLATLWDPPQASQPGAFAFRMFRNADGNGNGFGEISVQASSADSDQLAVYAAQRSRDGALTVMVINKTGGPLSSSLALSSFSSADNAPAYRYAFDQQNAITRLADQPLSPAGFQATYPGYSLTLYILPNAAGWHNLFVPRVVNH